MRYIFFGTPEFSMIILKKLIESGFSPVAVVCNPDRPIGRKKIITPPPIKKFIEDLGSKIEILQPENLKDVQNKLSAISPDFFVVAAYGKIISKEILEIPKLGTIGVHPSLLPKYRGPSPVQSVLLNDEKETGVTLYLLDEKMDHGQILSVVNYKLSDNETFETLLIKLAELSGKLLINTIREFLTGKIIPKAQNESEATYTKKFIASDGFIDTETLNNATSGKDIEAAKQIERKIRALSKEPGVWSYLKEKRAKLLEAEIRDQKLILKKIQVAGGKPKNTL